LIFRCDSELEKKLPVPLDFYLLRIETTGKSIVFIKIRKKSNEKRVNRENKKEDKIMNTTANSQIMRCPKCGANNRIAANAQTGAIPVCGRCKTPLAAEAQPVIFTDRNFAAEAEKSALPVLIDFWAAWCGPCRIIAPVIEQLAKELGGKVRVGKLNVDENQMTAARFRVQSIPTLLVLKNGSEVERIVGVQSKEAIRRRLEKYM
jgi:thioredoxin 2